jgi:Glu-tRNA(Gln) amidotransferase subunit E-like FAD-binding protein
VRRIAVKGRGTVELPAYGISDAEHQVEKELQRAWPDARVSVVDVARTEESRRIVEEFAVRYRVAASVEVDAESDDDARRAAFRSVRERLRSTRYAGIVLEPG